MKNNKLQQRREFLSNASKLGAIAGMSAFLPGLMQACQPKDTANAPAETDASMFFQISLAEWSLRNKLWKEEITNLDFPSYTQKTYGINAVEYVNQFFMDKAKDKAYLKDLKQRTDDLGMNNVLIMIDNEGSLATSDEGKRMEAVEKHYKWIEAANALGCKGIRVNANGGKVYKEAQKTMAESMRTLVEFADPLDINVMIENHGGFSSNGNWLSGLMKMVNHPRCGTLPDFGNFAIDREKGILYDPLLGTSQLMPYAKGVSAKSMNFDSNGDETTLDYYKLLQIVKTAGFEGFIGIEWGGGGGHLSDDEGIMATKELLMKIGKKIS
ncbi:sugar phosphate isomerase/epimerase family protein [Flammeovirgaceae bacterium SG7u.111]|nr:sugar phosphate isomerase/epimerase family protein [Flammeovirgaceae bacterium SG7u.111]